MTSKPIVFGRGCTYNHQATNPQVSTVVSPSPPEQHVCRICRVNIGPMSYFIWNREISRRFFSLGKLFDILRARRIKGMNQESNTRGEAFKSLWKHRGGCDIAAPNMLRAGEFDTPYAYCREEVTYVRRFHALIRACEAKKIDYFERVALLRLVLFHRTLHSVHLLRHNGRCSTAQK